MRVLFTACFLILTTAITMMGGGVIDVHSHIITPDFLTSLSSEGRLMDEGFPLPAYDAEAHLRWMDEAGIQTSVLTLAAPQPSLASAVRAANEAAAQLKKDYPGRFMFCAALPLPTMQPLDAQTMKLIFIKQR